MDFKDMIAFLREGKGEGGEVTAPQRLARVMILFCLAVAIVSVIRLVASFIR